MADAALDTVKVFDTWVEGTRGRLHFDVMTTDEPMALTLAKQYLERIGEGGIVITTKECRFCHSEPLAFFSADQQRQFKEHGGFIVSLPA